VGDEVVVPELHVLHVHFVLSGQEIREGLQLRSVPRFDPLILISCEYSPSRMSLNPVSWVPLHWETGRGLPCGYSDMGVYGVYTWSQFMIYTPSL
jgi:hypothetical protein